MDQLQHPTSAQVSGQMVQELQHIDRFIPVSTNSCQLSGHDVSIEPAIVAATSAHGWIKHNYTEPAHNQAQNRNQLGVHDYLTNESPQNRVLPTSVALMMTRNNCQRSPSILEQYTQTIPLSASCQSVQKRCLFPDCTKMSVSKGLCRGHGGGRRCHFDGGCTKSAQSRSMFCWAHGGGQRCDVETCMRSRKTKRFCVAHMHLETEESRNDSRSTSSGKNSRVPRARRSRYVPVPSRIHHQSSQRILPSLGQALSAASISLPSFPILPRVRARCLMNEVDDKLFAFNIAQPNKYLEDLAHRAKSS